VTDRRWPILWSIAIALPVIVILVYAYRWTMIRPRATNADRVIFISACAMTAILVGLSTLVRRGQRFRDRRNAGQCVSCGYDLRASPSRCPECGRPV
jgi:hypothetical protein